MAHDLSSTFSSITCREADREFRRDRFGDFDLRAIGPTGVIDANCRRIGGEVTLGPPSGRALEIEPDPYKYHVKITHIQPGYTVVYTGTALLEDGQVSRIVGVRRIILDADQPEIVKLLAFDQDEQTWVVTKP